VHNEEDRNPTGRGSNSLACEEEAVETKRKRRVSTGSPRSLHHQAAPIFSSEQTDEDAQCPCIHLRTVRRIHTYYPFRLCPQMRCRRAWHQGGRVVTAIPADVNSYVTPGNAPERAESDCFVLPPRRRGVPAATPSGQFARGVPTGFLLRAVPRFA
jgi:hypothetical protein